MMYRSAEHNEPEALRAIMPKKVPSKIKPESGLGFYALVMYLYIPDLLVCT